MTAIDLFVVPIMIGLIFISLLFGALLFYEFNNTLIPFINNSDNITKTEYEKVSMSMQKTVEVIDMGIPMVYIFLSIGIILLGFQLKTHPIFAPIMIVALILSIFFSMIIQDLSTGFLNGFSNAINVSEEEIINNTIPFTNTVMSYLPFLTLISGGLLIIVMFSNPRVEG